MKNITYTVRQGSGQVLQSQETIWFVVQAYRKGQAGSAQRACIFLPDTPKSVQDKLITQTKKILKTELEGL